MMRNANYANTALSLSLACALAGMAEAQVDVRIDFESFDNNSGSSANWNVINHGGTVNNLTDYVTGLGTGIDISVSGFNESQAEDFTWPTGPKLWLTVPAIDDAMGVGGGSATITFSNMGTEPYQIKIAAASLSSNQIGDYRINGVFGDRTYEAQAITVGDDWDANLNGVALQDWMIWDSVTPIGGVVTIDITAIENTAFVNAVRFIQVPEPGHYAALLGLGILALMIVKRRR